MSQVSFVTESNGQRIEVLAGWDAPCRWFFLVLTHAASGEVIYSNLDHPNPSQLGRDTSLFREDLAGRGITAPEGFWARVERCEGNVAHVHRAGGWQ